MPQSAALENAINATQWNGVTRLTDLAATQDARTFRETVLRYNLGNLSHPPHSLNNHLDDENVLNATHIVELRRAAAYQAITLAFMNAENTGQNQIAALADLAEQAQPQNFRTQLSQQANNLGISGLTAALHQDINDDDEAVAADHTDDEHVLSNAQCSELRQFAAFYAAHLAIQQCNDQDALNNFLTAAGDRGARNALRTHSAVLGNLSAALNDNEDNDFVIHHGNIEILRNAAAKRIISINIPQIQYRHQNVLSALATASTPQEFRSRIAMQSDYFGVLSSALFNNSARENNSVISEYHLHDLKNLAFTTLVKMAIAHVSHDNSNSLLELIAAGNDNDFRQALIKNNSSLGGLVALPLRNDNSLITALDVRRLRSLTAKRAVELAVGKIPYTQLNQLQTLINQDRSQTFREHLATLNIGSLHDALSQNGGEPQANNSIIDERDIPLLKNLIAKQIVKLSIEQTNDIDVLNTLISVEPAQAFREVLRNNPQLGGLNQTLNGNEDHDSAIIRQNDIETIKKWATSRKNTLLRNSLWERRQAGIQLQDAGTNKIVQQGEDLSVVFNGGKIVKTEFFEAAQDLVSQTLLSRETDFEAIDKAVRNMNLDGVQEEPGRSKQHILLPMNLGTLSREQVNPDTVKLSLKGCRQGTLPEMFGGLIAALKFECQRKGIDQTQHPIHVSQVVPDTTEARAALREALRTAGFATATVREPEVGLVAEVREPEEEDNGAGMGTLRP